MLTVAFTMMMPSSTGKRRPRCFHPVTLRQLLDRLLNSDQLIHRHAMLALCSDGLPIFVPNFSGLAGTLLTSAVVLLED